MGCCMNMGELAVMVEMWLDEQKELAAQEKRFYERKEAVLKRRREANRKFAISQEKETRARELWHLVQEDWRTWPADIQVVYAVYTGKEQVVPWRVGIKREVYREMLGVGRMLPRNTLHYVVRVAVTFCDGMIRMFTANPHIRSGGDWEDVVC